MPDLSSRIQQINKNNNARTKKSATPKKVATPNDVKVTPLATEPHTVIVEAKQAKKVDKAIKEKHRQHCLDCADDMMARIFLWAWTLVAIALIIRILIGG